MSLLNRIEREEINERLRIIEEYLWQIRYILERSLPKPKHFTIRQENPMLAIAPGNSPQFTATPQPAGTAPGTAPGPGLIPTWVSSDPTNAPVSVDATGLIATVAIPSTAVVGASFDLTVTLTNADGTVATGTATFTIVAPPSPDVTSFTIAQTL